jgi:hypothetical protein
MYLQTLFFQQSDRVIEGGGTHSCKWHGTHTTLVTGFFKVWLTNDFLIELCVCVCVCVCVCERERERERKREQ